MIIPNIWKNKIHVPNHQPVEVCMQMRVPPKHPNYDPRVWMDQGTLAVHWLSWKSAASVSETRSDKLGKGLNIKNIPIGSDFTIKNMEFSLDSTI